MARSKRVAAMLAGLGCAALLASAPVYAGPQSTGWNRGARNNLVVYREDACPQSTDDQIYVCHRRLTAEGVIALHRVATCFAARRPRAVQALLAMDVQSEEHRREMQRLVAEPGRCRPDRRLGFNSLLLAGALAEALLRRTPRRLDVLLRADPQRPIRARDDAEYMSLCVTGTDPAPVLSLLATRPASVEEEGVVTAMTPRLSPCLSQGRAANFNRPALRAHLALAALRLRTHNLEGRR